MYLQKNYAENHICKHLRKYPAAYSCFHCQYITGNTKIKKNECTKLSDALKKEDMKTLFASN